MKASDPDYTTYVALTKIATKEDPIKTKKQLDQAQMQVKATTAISGRINARNAAARLKIEAQKIQIELLKLKAQS